MYKLGVDKAAAPRWAKMMRTAAGSLSDKVVDSNLGRNAFMGGSALLAFLGRHLTSPKSDESPTASKVLSYGATIPAAVLAGLTGADLLRSYAPTVGILGGAALGGAGAGLLARIGRKKPTELPDEAPHV